MKPNGSRILLAVLAAAAFVVLSVGAPVSAKVMQAPGSRVSLNLPEAFKPSPLFAGFMDIISSAAVVVLEMPPESHGKVIAGFTAEALAKKGVMNAKRSKLGRTDDYFFVTGEQKFRRGLLDKFILVLKDDRHTAVITFNVPQLSYEDASIKRADVLAALKSAKLEPKAAPSRDLFKLTYTGPFELTGSPTGTSRTFVVAGNTDPKDTRTLIVVAPSLNRLPIRDIKEFSNYAFENLATIKDREVITTKQHRIDGLDGYEIIAKGRRGTKRTQVIVRQLMLVPSAGGYFRMLAVIKAEDAKRLEPEIDKIFAGFRLTGAGRDL